MFTDSDMRRGLRVALLTLVGVATVAICAGCAPAPGEEYTLEADQAFPATEREEIRTALHAWENWSDGLLCVALVDGPGDARIVREDFGTGRYSRRERALYVNPTELATYDNGLRAMTANLVGQFMGMKLHDGCGVLGAKCVTFEFTDADRASCRAAGYCR